MNELLQAAHIAAQQLDEALKRELQQGNHVQSGDLLRSIETRVEAEDDALVLKTCMLHYGQILNRRYGFINRGVGQTLPLIKQLVAEAIKAIITKQVKASFQ